MTEVRARWDTRYREGSTPWDTGITPPEVTQFWHSDLLPNPSVAIDLGCGPGTNAIFLSRQGLIVIGVDYSGIALEIARGRIAQRFPNGTSRVHLVHASVSQLPVANAGASYILDIGCLHGLSPEDRLDYVASVLGNLAPGGYYHLFAFDRTADGKVDPCGHRRGMGANEVAELFTPALAMIEISRGMPEPNPCRWYLLRRPL